MSPYRNTGLYPPNLSSSAEARSARAGLSDLHTAEGDREWSTSDTGSGYGAVSSDPKKRTQSAPRLMAYHCPLVFWHHQPTSSFPAAAANPGEPARTKIKPKGKGRKRADGTIPTHQEQQQHHLQPHSEPTITYSHPNGPAFEDYRHSMGFTQDVDSSSNQTSPLYPSQTMLASGIQQTYSISPIETRKTVSPPRGGGEEPPMERSQNAMAGPSNPNIFLQGLPPAIQSQMPGGADYATLPVGVSGGKIFKCMGFPGCEMTFTRSEHLARHVRKHTGERPFPCHCGKAFSRLDNLRQHSATVHSDSQELNERMLRALAPIHAALSQRAGKEQRQRGKCFRCPDGLIEHWQVYLKRGPSRGRDRLSSSTRSHQHHPRQTWHLCRRPILCNSNNNNINSKRQALINSNNINNSKR